MSKSQKEFSINSISESFDDWEEVAQPKPAVRDSQGDIKNTPDRQCSYVNKPLLEFTGPWTNSIHIGDQSEIEYLLQDIVHFHRRHIYATNMLEVRRCFIVEFSA